MLDTSKIYKSNKCGEFVVVKYSNYKKVTVRFVVTGSIVITRADSIISGNVKDRYYPSVFGVGFIGVGGFSSGSVHYRVWARMLERCYAGYDNRDKSYLGCTVCDEWHNFQNFAKWSEKHYIKGYQLDKDSRYEGASKKHYSSVNCKYISQSENLVIAHAKHYKFKSPSGVVINVYNLSSFCRDNYLSREVMSLVSYGTLLKRKGWSKA